MADRNLTAADLGLDLSDGRADQLYRWFLASVLFGRPVQQEVSARTYEHLVRSGLTSPGQFADHTHESLRALLDEAGYSRIDHVMSDELRGVMARVADEHGSVSQLVKRARDADEITATLTDLKGVGPKTAEIFLREVPAAVIGSARS